MDKCASVRAVNAFTDKLTIGYSIPKPATLVDKVLKSDFPYQAMRDSLVSVKDTISPSDSTSSCFDTYRGHVWMELEGRIGDKRSQIYRNHAENSSGERRTAGPLFTHTKGEYRLTDDELKRANEEVRNATIDEIAAQDAITLLQHSWYPQKPAQAQLGDLQY